jgi:hypothetical protein
MCPASDSLRMHCGTSRGVRGFAKKIFWVCKVYLRLRAPWLSTASGLWGVHADSVLTALILPIYDGPVQPHVLITLCVSLVCNTHHRALLCILSVGPVQLSVLPRSGTAVRLAGCYFAGCQICAA